MEKIKKIIPYIVILIMSIILILMSSSCVFGKVGLFWDASVYLNVSKNLTEGKVLYKDIVDNKGPVLYFINYVALELGGKIGVCIIEFIFIYTSLLFLYKSVKLIDNNKLKNLIMLFIGFICYARFFTFGLSCETYALTFSSIALYECLKYYKHGLFTNKQCILIGILFGLVFFIRANLIVVFVGFGMGIGIKLIIEKKFKELARYILAAILGVLVVCIPIFIYLIVNNCVYEFIENVFLLNTSMNRLGFFTSLYAMALIMPLTFIVILVYLGTSIYKVLKKDWFYISVILFIIITIAFNCISKQVYYHYFIAFIPLIILAYNNITNIMIKIVKRKILVYLIITSVIATYLCINGKRIFMFKVKQPNINTIEYIKNNTTTDSKIAIIGFSDDIYYLSDRQPVSKITYILSNDAFSQEHQTKILQQYIGDIINGKPAIIIEHKETLNSIVKKYIDITEYENLKKDKYVCISESNTEKIFKLKE